MTQDEMLAMISDLQKQARELKAQVNALKEEKPKKTKVSIMETFGETYPWMENIKSDIDKLSVLVRSICFEKGDKEWTYRWNKRGENTYKRVILTEDMTDDQKSRYVEICGKILAVLDMYEVVENTSKVEYKEENQWWDDDNNDLPWFSVDLNGNIVEEAEHENT